MRRIDQGAGEAFSRKRTSRGLIAETDVHLRHPSEMVACHDTGTDRGKELVTGIGLAVVGAAQHHDAALKRAKDTKQKK